MAYVDQLLLLLSIYALLALSLDLVVGHGGMLALCHGVFFAGGAYSAAALARHGVPEMAGTLSVGALGGAALALGVSAVALRVRGEVFVLLTIAVQLIATDILQNWESVSGGTFGVVDIPEPHLLGIKLSMGPSRVFAYVVVAVLASGALWLVQRAAFGRALRASRDDSRAAEGVGHDVRQLRRSAFIVAGAVAGLAGALFAQHASYIEPSSFAFSESILILTMVVVGGAASRFGPILGAAILIAIPEVLRMIDLPPQVAANLRQVLYGLLLIGVIVARPRGLVGRYAHDA